MAGFVIHNGEVTDFALPLLAEVCELLDSKLDAMTEEAAKCADPDALGLNDRFEYVAGFAFVACQEYLLRICEGDSHRKALLETGPQRGPYSLARIVNAAANRWKHNAEWGEAGGHPQTLEVFEGLGIDPRTNYPASSVLSHLQGDFPRRFGAILPGLEAWRDAALTMRGII